MKKASAWILVLVLLGMTYYKYHHYGELRAKYQLTAGHPSSTLNFVSAARGIRRKVPLPDGSTVWLNAASTLSYPSDIASGNRSLEMVGEAFFDVSPVAAHPFNVRAKNLLVEVLGTRFNMRCYPEEKDANVLVTEGRVRVVYNEDTALLSAGQQVNIFPGELHGGTMNVIQREDTATAADWRKGIISITNTDLSGLLRELSRSYNVDISLEGDVTSRHFNGIVSLSEPIETVVQRFVQPYAHVRVTRLSKTRLLVSVTS